jgi:hypothetical protein
MNYVALIALLAALAFTLPLLVKLTEAAGLARGVGVVGTLVVAAVVLLWLWLGGRRQRRRLLKERVAAIKRQRARAPEDPTAFLEAGDHLSELLLQLDRPKEAREAFSAYLEVAARAGQEVAEPFADLKPKPPRARPRSKAENPLEDEHASI